MDEVKIMKKRILLIAMMLLLIVSCGKKGDDPVDVLKNVYQNHKDLSSYTADMTSTADAPRLAEDGATQPRSSPIMG